MVRSQSNGASLKGSKGKKASHKAPRSSVKSVASSRLQIADADDNELGDAIFSPKPPREMDERDDLGMESILEGTATGIDFQEKVKDFSALGDLGILYLLRWWQPEDLDLLADDIRRMAEHRRKVIAAP